MSDRFYMCTETSYMLLHVSLGVGLVVWRRNGDVRPSANLAAAHVPDRVLIATELLNKLHIITCISDVFSFFSVKNRANITRPLLYLTLQNRDLVIRKSSSRCVIGKF